jgi:hypothetical protein
MKFPFSSLADAYTRSVTHKLESNPEVDPPPAELFNSVKGYISVFIESNIPNVKRWLTKIVSSNSNSGSARVAALVLDIGELVAWRTYFNMAYIC